MSQCLISFALRADLSVSVVGRQALVRPALRAIAGWRPYWRSVATQRPRRSSKPGCQRAAERANHRELMKEFRGQLMGKLAPRFRRFPLLLKFLDARELLSVQVHPSDAHPELLPPGETSKTEAWVVIEANKGSHIYAGLKPGTTADDLRHSLTDGTIVDHLVNIVPKSGEGVFIPAGTVHTLGGGVVVFEIQQNSDVTFRLYDWNHVDAKTGKPRPLQVDQALASIDLQTATVAS